MEFFSLLMLQILIMLLLVSVFALILYKFYRQLSLMYPLLVSVLAAIAFTLIFNIDNLLSLIALLSNILFSIMVYLVALNQQKKIK
ncbi:hypothetical protein CN378_03085 [Bacillus sp. AFS015802]|nr:hypothetical protein CN378_03085 [Bacillus sp. AFS015802]